MEKLKEYISPEFCTNLDVFEKFLENESSFKPYGKLLDEFLIGELWKNYYFVDNYVFILHSR